jgi:hypothetical protein
LGAGGGEQTFFATATTFLGAGFTHTQACGLQRQSWGEQFPPQVGDMGPALQTGGSFLGAVVGPVEQQPELACFGAEAHEARKAAAAATRMAMCFFMAD